MYKRLAKRAEEPEMMDDFYSEGAELAEALRHLRRLNRIFSASGPIVYGVDRLWRKAGRPLELSVFDVGCGSGDINRRLLQWADRRGIRLRMTLGDVTEEAREEAERLFQGDDRVQVTFADLFDLPANCADIVTASQVLHHVAQEKLPGAMRSIFRASRLGAVVGDIHRHRVAWLAVWGTTRLLSRNRFIRNDGPLSVAKGFRSEDWERLSTLPDLSGLRYSWRPLFRWSVIVPHNRGL